MEWQNILAWVDAADFEHEDRLIDAFDRLFDLLIDSIVDRHTEQAVFHNGLKTACKKSLTPAQKEAKLLEAEAVALGRNPARYVATMRGISTSAAYALLKRADGRMLNFSSVVGVKGVDNVSRWIPERVDVDRKLRAIRTVCAAGGQHCKGEAPARFTICWECRKEFGAPHDWDEITRRWLLPEVRRLKRLAYREAVNLLYAERREAGIVDDINLYELIAEAV